MKKNLITLFLSFLCCLFVGAQPLIRETPFRGNHHTHRLPGVNERRLARLNKMREANVARRHRHGPWRAQTQPETQRGLVLLVEFSDESMKTGAATQWYNRFNQEGFSLDRHVGSVRDYFLEQSYGMLTIDFDVVGPLTLSKTREYYGTAPNSRLDDRAAEMVIEALRLANSQVDYSDYDWDGDGEVDQVYVIYAGITQADTQGYIWPHEWALSSAKYFGCGTGYQRLDGVYIDTYAVSNELATASSLEGIGTACHEFSHCLGYPDFYDTDYTGGTAAQGWDVLDGGSYNGPRNIGEVPSPYTAYERWTAGWIDLIPLTEPCKITDMPAINEQGVAYVINNTGNVNEYYILENRQKITFGTGNGGHGLMVWHIDYDQTAWSNNKVNSNKDHQRMTFLPADGQVGVLVNNNGYYQYQISADDEAGDPYPGKQNVDSVAQLTWYIAERNGTKKHPNLIHDITESYDGKISFIYGDYYVLPAPEVDYPTDITDDSFTANWFPVEGATSYTLEVEAISGELQPAIVFAEDFANFKSVAADSQISSSEINEYTRMPGWDVFAIYGTRDSSVLVGAMGSIGYITTPAIESRVGTLTVEFGAASYNADGNNVVVSVLKDEQELATQSIILTASRATYSCTFENIPSGCKIKLASTARRKRIVIYNVNIMDMSGAGGISTMYTGLTSTSFIVEPINSDMYYYRVQAVCEDGTSEWSDWMDIDIAAPIGKLREQETDKGIAYDLMGRRLQRVPQHGIYIQKGKTHIAY